MILPADIYGALTVYPEWAWAFNLGKNIENRTWPPPKKSFGKWIAIRAGKHMGGRIGFPAALEGFGNVARVAELAGYSASVIPNLDTRNPRIVVAGPPGVHFTVSREMLRRSAITHICKLGTAGEVYGHEGPPEYPWAFPGQIGWLFTEVRKLSCPLACRGGLGVRPIDLADKIEIIRRAS